MTSVIDTLRMAQALKEAGFDDRQSETIVTVIRQSMGENFATKGDLKAEIAELRADLYRALWLQAAGIVGALTAIGGIIVGIVTAVT